MPLEKDLEPGKKWAFDEAVAKNFDDMLERSIPDHAGMRQLCFDLGNKHVQPKTAIIDMGCSRGQAMQPFIDRHGATCQHVGLEVSPAMLEEARARFKGYIDCGVVSILGMDLRKEFPPFKSSLVLCVLTLQFTPIEHRQRIVKNAWKSLVSGGAMILVEKVLGSSEATDKLLNEAYWDMKRANGYGADEVERKRLSLEGVLVPITAAWNEDLLRSAGFSQVECFWRNLNFAGWIAVKE